MVERWGQLERLDNLSRTVWTVAVTDLLCTVDELGLNSPLDAEALLLEGREAILDLGQRTLGEEGMQSDATSAVYLRWLRNCPASTWVGTSKLALAVLTHDRLTHGAP